MKIGPYEVIRELGRGSFAAVYLAQRSDLPRKVAVKVLMKLSPEDRARFKREAKVTSGLEHPGIVSCYDIGQDERGFLYLALDFAPGGSLDDRLEAGPLRIDEAVGLVARLADAIEYAHGKGILHRDLKPANILFDGAGQPRVSDFGLASYRGHMRLTHSEDVLGTPHYMAPEQFEGRTISPQVDIYGLGAILYHALTGDVIHPAEDLAELRESVRRARRVAPPSSKRPGISPALDEVCLTAIAHDPDDRYMTAAEMASALRSARSTRPEKSPPQIPWPLVGGVLGLALVLVIAGLVAVSSGPSAAPSPPVTSEGGAPPPVTPLAPPPDPLAALDPPVTQRAPLQRSREAIARWGFAEAEGLLKVARDGGAPSSEVADVEGELAAAQDAEMAAARKLSEAYIRDLRPGVGLQQAEDLLKHHRNSVQLRLVAARLCGVLGRYAAGLEYLDAVVGLDPNRTDGQHTNRRYMRAMGELAAREPWTDNPPFIEWQPVHGGQWRREEPGQFRGRLIGMAQFGFAGLVNTSAGKLSAPYEVSVELDLDTSQPSAFAGIILGLQDANTCLLVYVLHDTRVDEELGIDQATYRELLAEARGFDGEKALRYARWKDGEWEQIESDFQVRFEDTGWTRLSVAVGDGQLQATVNREQVPAVRLPDRLDGRIGVIKWYDNVVGFRKFSWRRR